MPSKEELKAGTEDAQKIAEKIGDLLISKCGDKYFFARYPDSYAKELVVKADPRKLSSEEHFYGYEWKGYVLISPKGSNGGDEYQIYKRGGKWYFRPTESGEKDDIPVELLKSVRPECPVMGSYLPGAGKDIPSQRVAAGMTSAKVAKAFPAADIDPREKKCSSGTPCWYYVTLNPPNDREISAFWPSDGSNLPKENSCIEANLAMSPGMRYDGGLSDPMHYLPQMIWYRVAQCDEN